LGFEERGAETHHEVQRGSGHERNDEEHRPQHPRWHLPEDDTTEPGEESSKAGKFEGPPIEGKGEKSAFRFETRTRREKKRVENRNAHLVLMSIDGEMLV